MNVGVVQGGFAAILWKLRVRSWNQLIPWTSQRHGDSLRMERLREIRVLEVSVIVGTHEPCRSCGAREARTCGDRSQQAAAPSGRCPRRILQKHSWCSALGPGSNGAAGAKLGTFLKCDPRRWGVQKKSYVTGCGAAPQGPARPEVCSSGAGPKSA